MICRNTLCNYFLCFICLDVLADAYRFSSFGVASAVLLPPRVFCFHQQLNILHAYGCSVDDCQAVLSLGNSFIV